jgi:hypothetical protein
MVTADGEVWKLSDEILHDRQEIRISLHHRKEEGASMTPSPQREGWCQRGVVSDGPDGREAPATVWEAS